MDFESDEKKTFSKLLALGLIFKTQKCTNEKCVKRGDLMELRNRKRNKDSKNQLLSWRCMACTNYKTIYQDSFFSLFCKPLKIVLAIIKCWSAQVNISKTVDLINLHFEHNVHRNTVAVIFFRLRQLCTLSIDKKNLKLGGPGQIIEIDESLYAKVKHFKGKTPN